MQYWPEKKISASRFIVVFLVCRIDISQGSRGFSLATLANNDHKTHIEGQTSTSVFFHTNY